MQEPATFSVEWPSLDAVRPAPGVLLAGGIVTGVCFDLAVRSGTAALGAAATVWALVATLVAVRRAANRWGVGCFAAAAALAAWLVLRASPWLVLPDLVAITFLLTVGALLGDEGSPFDLRWSTLGIRALRLLPRLVWIPGWMLGPAIALGGQVTASRRSDVIAIVRGVAIAVPIVVVLGVLLGSADPVFASFFNVGGFSDPGDAILHVGLVAAGALLPGIAAGGLSIAYPDAPARRVGLGSREALVVMSVIDVLFALFALAQVVAALGGGAAALRSAGVTYADYARSGFFQLLWVAGLTWLVAVVARGALPAGPGAQRRALIASIEVAIGLVLLIVYVAHSRLQLYEDAYGFTMLRLYSHVFSGLVAAAFVVLGVSVAGVGSARAWLFGSVAALTLAALVGLNAANPESVVVGLNVQRAQRTGDLDAGYLGSLSDDAVPTMLAEAPGLGAANREALVAAICATPAPAPTGWAASNVATRLALEARGRSCPPTATRGATAAAGP
jgi:hypothetical protein